MWLTVKIGLSKNSHYALNHSKVEEKVDQSDTPVYHWIPLSWTQSISTSITQ